jgi:hypothetical protein
MLHNNDQRLALDVPALAEHGTVPSRLVPPGPPLEVCRASSRLDLEVAVDYILVDCFFAVGQAVGSSKTIEHSALMWWRDRYRAKFVHAMTLFGNRWLSDRSRVLSVCRMLGEHAVQYAEHAPAIDVQSAAKASARVEEFCVKHALRRQRRLGLDGNQDRPELFAGYWCAM